MNNNWNTPLTDEQIKATLKVANDKLGVNTKELVDTTGYTPSKLVETLNKVVVENALYKPEYEYVLTKIKGLIPVINGIKSYDYMDFTDGDNRNARDDNSMDDFNADFEPVLREVFEVNEEFHKKNKLPELILSDAWSVANTITNFVAGQREANMKALSKAVEFKMWKALSEKATIVEVGEGADAIAYAEALYNQLQKYETTSNKHLGIGENGVITIDTNGQGDTTTLQPDKKFNTADFYIIERPDQNTSITFEGEAAYFNWNATLMPIAGRIVLDIDIYTGMSDEVRTALEGGKIILFHKDALEALEFFNYQSVVKGASAYEVIHTFEEWDVYQRKDRPILIFKDTAETTPTDTYYKIECTGDGVGTCVVDTEGGTDFANDNTCGGTDFSTCTAPAAVKLAQMEKEKEELELQLKEAQSKIDAENSQVQSALSIAEETKKELEKAKKQLKDLKKKNKK